MRRFLLLAFAALGLLSRPLSAQCRLDPSDPAHGIGIVDSRFTPLIVERVASVTGLYINVKDCGAKGDGVTDDWAIIQGAIDYSASLGSPRANAVIYFPPGRYVIKKTLKLPVLTSGAGQIILRGGGMRITYIYPSGPSTAFTVTGTQSVAATILFGAAVPDAAGTSTNNTEYLGMEDMSVNGSLLTTGNFRAVVLTQCQNCWIKNSIIESFPNSSVGLYLAGSTVTGGLGTSTTAPHTWRSRFDKVIVTTIGSGAASTPSAMVLQNADENDFYNCSFSTTPLLTPGADLILTVKVELGRNNRWYGALYSGDVTAGKTNYVALKFGPPVNEAGVANGSVLQNQDYGAVAEGFDRAFWFGGDNSGNTLGNSVVFSQPSIYTTAYLDDNPALTNGGFVGGGNGGNIFWAPLLNIMYGAVASPSQPMGIFADAATTPNVGGSDHWQTANTGATIITDFLVPTGASRDGRHIRVQCNDNNTTIRDVNNGGGGNIRNFGRRDLTCRTGAVYEWEAFGSATWIQVNIAGGYTGASQIEIPVAMTCGAATTPAVDVAAGNYFTCNITSNVAVVVAVPSNRPPAGSSEEIVIALRNSSGGALGTAPTFNGAANGFKFSAVTNMATGTQVLYTFRWDGVQSFWYEVGTHLAAGL